MKVESVAYIVRYNDGAGTVPFFSLKAARVFAKKIASMKYTARIYKLMEVVK